MKAILFTTAFLCSMISYGQTFTLRSKDLGGQAAPGQVGNDYGCKGQNLSPQLYWENAPAGAKSFAVTMYDQDAPTGSGWWHWLIFDISKNCTELKTGAGDILKQIAPAQSVQSKTDFGLPGYGGPCPPPGSPPHRYIITLFALKTEKLGLNAFANPALVGFYLEKNSIEKASLIFYYKQ